jgi:hypothetical protein
MTRKTRIERGQNTGQGSGTEQTADEVDRLSRSFLQEVAKQTEGNPIYAFVAVSFSNKALVWTHAHPCYPRENSITAFARFPRIIDLRSRSEKAIDESRQVSGMNGL